jgi:hypothetical protein
MVFKECGGEFEPLKLFHAANEQRRPRHFLHHDFELTGYWLFGRLA